MQTSNMKNIVVLKNLPSNIVDEAIVILKQTKKTKNLELINKQNKTIEESKKENSEQYILKEAENLIKNCIGNIEKTKEEKYENLNIKRKYNILKKYSIIASIALFISIIINII